MHICERLCKKMFFYRGIYYKAIHICTNICEKKCVTLTYMCRNKLYMYVCWERERESGKMPQLFFPTELDKLKFFSLNLLVGATNASWCICLVLSVCAACTKSLNLNLSYQLDPLCKWTNILYNMQCCISLNFWIIEWIASLNNFFSTVLEQINETLSISYTHIICWITAISNY